MLEWLLLVALMGIFGVTIVSIVAIARLINRSLGSGSGLGNEIEAPKSLEG